MDGDADKPVAEVTDNGDATHTEPEHEQVQNHEHDSAAVEEDTDRPVIELFVKVRPRKLR